jgi:fibronectin type 3 domain-containing protein
MQDGHEDRRVDEPGLPSETRHHLGPWLRALAGLCLAAAVAGGAVIVAGGSTAGADAHIADPSLSASCSSDPKPLPPYCLNAEPDDTKVHLTWDPAAPVKRKPAIYYGTSKDIRQNIGHVDVTDTDPTASDAMVSDATVSDLTNGTTYYFWLIEDQFPHVVSNMASATPVARPGAPTGLTVKPGNSQVTLSWTAPASDGGSRVSSYNVVEGTTADLSGSAPVTNVTGTTVTLPALINGTTYYFWVTAVNGVGEGPPSNEVSAVPLTLPGAPTGLTATPGNSQVTLSWAAPASDGGSRVSSYNVVEGTTADLSGSAPVTNVTGTTVTLPSLINGTTYFFEVAAVNAAGQGPLSTEMQAVPVTVPEAPTGLTATRGNTQVVLSWTAPASDGGSQVTGYELYVGTTADLSGNAPVARVTGTVVTVTNLINGTRYYFGVTAVNRVGEGRPSNEVSAVPLTVPGAPTGLTATPSNSQVSLSWAAPTSGGAAISGYLVYEGTSPRHETGKPINGSLVNGTSYTITGLANGTTYYFRVTAVNTAGEGPSSAEMPVTLQPIVSSSGPPTSPTSSTTSPTSSTTSSTTTPASTNTPTSGTATTPAASAQSSAGTHARGAAAPIGLAATPGNAQVHLSWIAAAPDGSSPAAGYRIYLASQPGMQAGGAIGSTKGTDVTVAHLANGTTYYFMVTTVGAAGDESPYSAQVAAEPRAGVVVPLNPPGPPKWLITLLAAAGAIVVAGALTLIRGRFRARKPDHPARAREQIALAQDVRAVPDTARPDMVSVHNTGPEPTHTVRLEPHPGTITTTIKEGRP